jgi:hypothetical protein
MGRLCSASWRMARVFAVMAGANFVIRVSRYNFTKWPGLSPGIGCCKWALVRSRNKHYGFVLVAGANAKSVTNNLPILKCYKQSCLL